MKEHLSNKCRRDTDRWVGTLLVSLLFFLSACNTNASQLAGAALAEQSVASVAAAELQAQAEGTLTVDYSPTTGVAHWVSAEGGAVTRQFARQNLGAEGAARAFMGAYGRLFGVADQATELQVKNIATDELGMQHVHFQQTQNGIEVFGADLKVHLDGEGAVQVVNGYTLPDARNVDVGAVASAATAEQGAIAYTRLADGVVSEKKLVILNLGLLTAIPSPSYLTYQVLVDSPSQPEKAQWVFVDANSGDVRFTYPANYEARNRTTYNVQSGSNVTAAQLLRNETSPPVTSATNCSAQDINNAHDYAGQTYDFYWLRFGRDSYDGLGAPLKSYVCYGANYQNAFWSSYFQQMVYGKGFTADDVVAHELSHAVTQRSSNLNYNGQSGALNESFSDIMGEALDLTNNSGGDAESVRWDVGEDIPGLGASRDMMNPERFGDPDSTTSPNYYCGTGDNGGVHTNSGVLNKAFALMVDGGTLNGITVSKLGLDLPARVIYRANTSYLSSSARFIDAYNAIRHACNDIITSSAEAAAHCTTIKLALDATRMNWPICGVDPTKPTTPTPDRELLENGNFETGRNNGWVEQDSGGLAVVTSQAVAYNGTWLAWLGGAHNSTSSVWQQYRVPAGSATLTYSYKISSSDTCGYDFAYVQVNGTILATYQLCYSNNSQGGYVQGSVSLNAYAGRDVRVEFKTTTDDTLTSNFFVDAVAAYTSASALPETDTRILVGEALVEAKSAEPLAVVEEKSLLRHLFLPLVSNQ